MRYEERKDMFFGAGFWGEKLIEYMSLQGRMREIARLIDNALEKCGKKIIDKDIIFYDDALKK